jgi:serine/threonine protein kinase
MEPPLWTEGPSSWPWEREALAFIRSRLPNHEPYRAWSNIEFLAGDGTVNEVDLLVVTGRGLFLVEIKSWPGTLTGDGQLWRLRRPPRAEEPIDHPLRLTNRKAQRLKSLLAHQRAFRDDRPPWVTPLVFLSSPELDCRLNDDIARASVCGRDRDPTPPGGHSVQARPGPLPGIVEALKNPETIGLRPTPINRPMSARVAAAVEQAGIKPSNRSRRVGDWKLGEPLDEGVGWQDFAATRPRIRFGRRVRVYLTSEATTADEEQQLRRQAEREFRILQGLRHEGIAQALELHRAERGPAVLFELDPAEQRLDLWALTQLDRFDPADRIELVRQLAEAIAYAHANKVSHRAMTARSILVRPPADGGDPPLLLIGHWQAGTRDLATRLTTHVTSATGSLGAALTEQLDAAEQVYLAPEAFSVSDPDGSALDVFSLGAIAYLLLSGRPPASDLTERDAMLAERGGLALDTVIDNPPHDLVTFIALATDPVPARRATVRELLQLLDDALDELTAPAEVSDEATIPTATADPLAAHQGDTLDGGWEVVRRLGSGSTAVALLCRRSGATEPEVLKVAKDEEHAERFGGEARALQQLRHPGIVELLGVERIGGRTTLRLAPAGDPDDKLGMTLADRLSPRQASRLGPQGNQQHSMRGRLGRDLLERFGDDLLEIVAYLESERTLHRDIKPDNLGVRPRGDRSLHLVLFDFSLAHTPDTSLTAGTSGYLDPFLAERPNRRWDLAAERYAASATLYEMATGTRPVWGDGSTDPIFLDDQEPRVDAELLDPSVREGLIRFFAKALHRRPSARFDTCDEMRQAWRVIFASAARPITRPDERPDVDIPRTNADRIIHALRKHGPLSDAQLVQVTGIVPYQQVNGICHRLEGNGVLRRKKSLGGPIINELTPSQSD